MDQLRQVLGTIGKYLGQLGPTQKMLIAALAVIGAMALFLVSQYAGKPNYVALLPGAPAAEQQRALAFLQSINMAAEMKGSEVVVPPESARAALAQLTEAGRMPGDLSEVFKNILDRQTWYTSRQQSEQYYLIDLQNLLGKVISNFRGVRSATVIIDAPPPNGIGASVRRPTASATVFTSSGSPLDQPTVDAIGNLIAGARAGLDVQNVRVIDGSSGRQRKVSNPADLVPTSYLEHATRVENQTRDKIADLLAYIPGVIVAVTAQVDVTSVTAQVRKNFATGEGTVSLPRMENTKKLSQRESSRGGEPGIRSNVGAEISGSGGSGSNTEDEQSESTFENMVGGRTEQIVDPRGMPTNLGASINLPRGYIVQLIKSSRGAAGEGEAAAGEEAEPTEAEIDARFKLEQAKVVETVRPHVRTRSMEGTLIDGEIAVAMIPVDMPPTATATQAGLIGGLASGGSLFGVQGLIDKVMLGILALVAMTMMVSMARKAGRKVELPTAEELVGTPPPLETRSEVIGDADESEAAMAGIEVDEQQMETQKMLESVNKFVQDRPDTAAKLLGRWIAVEE
ncbi:MAG: hypothetical protein SFZ23_01050 [Planctomycetota bacterium]|nr:hypothetical protein [Planctomycetota bacterium]